MGVSCSRETRHEIQRQTSEERERELQEKREEIKQLSQPRPDDTKYKKNVRALAVIQLVEECRQPELWLAAASYLLSPDGYLDNVSNYKHLPAIEFLLDSNAANDITGLGFGGWLTDGVISFLIKAPHLQQLDLTSSSLTDSGLLDLHSAFSSMTRLFKLDLKDNYFGDIGAVVVTEIAVKLPCMRELVLYDNNITATGVAKVGDIARQKPDMWLPCIGVQYKDVTFGIACPGRKHSDEDKKLRLANIRSLIRQAQSLGGNWARDLPILRQSEQSTEQSIGRVYD